MSEDAQKKLGAAYDELSKMEIQMLSQMAADEVRDKIDAAITNDL